MFGGRLGRKSAQRKALRAFFKKQSGRNIIFGGRWGEKKHAAYSIAGFFSTKKAVGT
jgi:hypothetical protein